MGTDGRSVLQEYGLRERTAGSGWEEYELRKQTAGAAGRNRYLNAAGCCDTIKDSATVAVTQDNRRTVNGRYS